MKEAIIKQQKMQMADIIQQLRGVWVGMPTVSVGRAVKEAAIFLNNFPSDSERLRDAVGAAREYLSGLGPCLNEHEKRDVQVMLKFLEDIEGLLLEMEHTIDCVASVA